MPDVYHVCLNAIYAVERMEVALMKAKIWRWRLLPEPSYCTICSTLNVMKI